MASNGKAASAIARQNAPRAVPKIRCAIYTRKSTEEGLEQEFNTLDAQRDAAEAYIRSQTHEGWAAIPEHYDDGGYTGANMDRPALKKLLEDVEAKAIDCVVVYKVDRLTRSLLDFAKIVEVLDRNSVNFVSITQQFNTTSSLGRLTLNILLSFAQFEREMISERTRDKMCAARKRGRWVGGQVLLGYDLRPNAGGLVANKEEAERVRAIFNTYLEQGSLHQLVAEVERRGWQKKEWITRSGKLYGGGTMSRSYLYNMLTNVTYVGQVSHKGTIYPGEHEPIVDRLLWDRVQAQLRDHCQHAARELKNKYGALLRGLLRCGSCGTTMLHSYTAKPNCVYRYYVCAKAHQRGWDGCETKSVSAVAIEEAVIARIRGIGTNHDILQAVIHKLDESHKARMAEIQNEQRTLERDLQRHSQEMTGLMSFASFDGPAARLATDRMADLQERMSKITDRISELRKAAGELALRIADYADVQSRLTTFDEVWRQMSVRQQEKFISALIERVTYDGRNGNVTIGFRSAELRSLCESSAERS